MDKHNKKQYKERSIVEYLSKLEEQFFLSGYGCSIVEPFTILEGSNKVMLSAHHCTKHFRDGKF